MAPPTECQRVFSAPYPGALARAARVLLEETLSLVDDNPPCRVLARDVLERYPAYRARFEEAAEVLGADPLDAVLATLSYDLTMGRLGCSTVALATAEGPVMARNMDWEPTDLIARASCERVVGHVVDAGFVASVGVVTGLSARGFAVALNAVDGDPLEPSGYPVLLFLRHLLEQALDFTDAVRLASTTPLMTSALLTLVGTRNPERAVIERTPSTAAVRRPQGDEPLLATNHYRLLDQPLACELDRRTPSSSLA